jgi:hypothetical protein
MTPVSEPSDASGQAVSFINLPNGQVLAAADSRDWIYTPAGAPQQAWRPTVTSVSANGNGSYHLAGTQLPGFVTTGEDDYQDPQNFPVVYLKDSAGNVYYALLQLQHDGAEHAGPGGVRGLHAARGAAARDVQPVRLGVRRLVGRRVRVHRLRSR